MKWQRLLQNLRIVIYPTRPRSPPLRSAHLDLNDGNFSDCDGHRPGGAEHPPRPVTWQPSNPKKVSSVEPVFQLNAGIVLEVGQIAGHHDQSMNFGHGRNLSVALGHAFAVGFQPDASSGVSRGSSFVVVKDGQSRQIEQEQLELTAPFTCRQASDSILEFMPGYRRGDTERMLVSSRYFTVRRNDLGREPAVLQTPHIESPHR